jgi:hypothetical protein
MAGSRPGYARPSPGHGILLILIVALFSSRLSRATPHPQRVEPWKLKKAWYRRRNEIERLFRRLKGFRRIFSRFDKLDLVFIAFIYFALLIEAVREC